MPKIRTIDVTLLHKDGHTRIIYRNDLGWDIQRYRRTTNAWSKIWRSRKKRKLA